MTLTIQDMLDDLADAIAPASYICLAIINEAGKSQQQWYSNEDALHVVELIKDAALALEDLRNKISSEIENGELE